MAWTFAHRFSVCFSDKKSMKQWVKKLVDQLDVHSAHKDVTPDLNEERATLLFLLETFNKHLFDVDHHPVRKTRETLDELSKILIDPTHVHSDKVLFRIRQFFASYRVDEYTYVQKTFEEFKQIIWDFADQLGEDMKQEKKIDNDVANSLSALQEAVEANSIEELKNRSREFIDFYTSVLTQKEERRSERMGSLQKNLYSVKKQLIEANETLNTDHLTGAHNRRSYDDQVKKMMSLKNLSGTHCTMILLDIDHFKKVNDTYGHDVGDYVISQCVRLLKEVFTRDEDFIARIGGEEFIVLLPSYRSEHAEKKAQLALEHIAHQVYVHQEHQIKFTVSMGIAELDADDTAESWYKRADQALYTSKQGGRNRFTTLPHTPSIKKVAS